MAKGLVRSQAGNLMCIIQPLPGKIFNRKAPKKTGASSLDQAFSKHEASGKDLDQLLDVEGNSTMVKTIHRNCRMRGS